MTDWAGAELNNLKCENEKMEKTRSLKLVSFDINFLVIANHYLTSIHCTMKYGFLGTNIFSTEVILIKSTS